MKFIVTSPHGFPIEVEMASPVTETEIAQIKSCIQDIHDDRWEEITLDRIQKSQETLLKLLKAVKAKAREYEPEQKCDCGRCRAARGEI